MESRSDGSIRAVSVNWEEKSGGCSISDRNGTVQLVDMKMPKKFRNNPRVAAIK